ncbi:hypothetical protein DPMN_013987 [Dreissena polymorpha]|uniref:DUF5641 domain-containing protein n=1 Tax=Dreissena polymorpha TaxID=45954 RepID=A0A9D4S457_DREPO|nr:hypothetical protein DPMN_013987 [Dreissena polymorpha]
MLLPKKLALDKRKTLLIQHFWDRWKDGYLTALRGRHRVSGSNDQTLRVGDVVQIHDELSRCNRRSQSLPMSLTEATDLFELHECATAMDSVLIG